MEDYTYRYAMEAQKLVDENQMEAHNFDILEKEAAEFLKVYGLVYNFICFVPWKINSF